MLILASAGIRSYDEGEKGCCFAMLTTVTPKSEECCIFLVLSASIRRLFGVRERATATQTNCWCSIVGDKTPLTEQSWRCHKDHKLLFAYASIVPVGF
jgi:hypothetical protein